MIKVKRQSKMNEKRIKKKLKKVEKDENDQIKLMKK